MQIFLSLISMASTIVQWENIGITQGKFWHYSGKILALQWEDIGITVGRWLCFVLILGYHTTCAIFSHWFFVLNPIFLSSEIYFYYLYTICQRVVLSSNFWFGFSRDFPCAVLPVVFRLYLRMPGVRPASWLRGERGELAQKIMSTPNQWWALGQNSHTSLKKRDQFPVDFPLCLVYRGEYRRPERPGGHMPHSSVAAAEVQKQNPQKEKNNSQDFFFDFLYK